MTKIFILLVMFSTIRCVGQKNVVIFTVPEFNTQFLNFKPVNLGIAESKFKDALFILEQSKERIKKNNNRFDFLDYWNILVILNRLNESENNLDVAFNKFKDAEGSCEYLTSPLFQREFYKFSQSISLKLNEAASKCPAVSEVSFDLNEYISKSNLDRNLVKLMSEIEENDQQHRIKEINLQKQKLLDDINQIRIDSLYSKHRTYIGKTLVGAHFENVMWEVIQHSNFQYMEKYLGSAGKVK